MNHSAPAAMAVTPLPTFITAAALVAAAVTSLVTGGTRPAAAEPPRAPVVAVLVASTPRGIIIFFITTPTMPGIVARHLTALRRHTVAVNDAMDPGELVDVRVFP